MNLAHIQIMNQMEHKSHEYCAIKRYWKLIQQDSRQLNDKRFYRPTFRMHLTNKEIVQKLIRGLKKHYEIYQLLLFYFQEKHADHFFGLIQETYPSVHPLFQTVFRTFLRHKQYIENALETDYSNAKTGGY